MLPLYQATLLRAARPSRIYISCTSENAEFSVTFYSTLVEMAWFGLLIFGISADTDIYKDKWIYDEANNRGLRLPKQKFLLAFVIKIHELI